ncbi:chorismate lyase [Vibrio scophthalmi]|uniref:Probable chorismate pyruvate-lyase n=2 Tax=Vibrio scophthalmi TaxID=45658 RepID=A0A1B1NJI9_9VIBR|nr:chorismate lyase [Vibrio scophthalmi]ANS83860.1 Chorismate lyase [Vibrio scophthalmi]ANU38013.1 Chorismate lyase [Vibrio scophthalmi]EGU30006.1 chorismate--pyruvate lyase [Vibrio scophthalmi LMG 19158]ODS12666.1 Chorismate lyase [Vibrio scophthalmi]
MNQMIALYLSALRQVEWQQPENFNFPSQIAREWLLEQGSLSRLLKTYCQQLNVDLLHNDVVLANKLDEQEIALLSQEQCLLRKVVLKGDGEPWILGRTLIPQSSLTDQPHDLTQQGEIPLGLTVFSAENVERDALQVGWAKTPNGLCLARRSRLWMNHKPMLVAELFLLNAPIYAKESV